MQPIGYSYTIFFVIFAVCLICQEIRHARERSRLIDRIMARDYGEYERAQLLKAKIHKVSVATPGPETDEELAAFEQNRNAIRLDFRNATTERIEP